MDPFGMLNINILSKNCCTTDDTIITVIVGIVIIIKEWQYGRRTLSQILYVKIHLSVA